MKNQFQLWIIILSLFTFSCKKETTTQKFNVNPSLEKYTSKNIVKGLDSITIKIISDSFSYERNVFINQFDKDYPNERASADKNLDAIMAIKDTTQYNLEFNAFQNKYLPKLKSTWNKVNFDPTTLREKYKKILGHNLFEFSEYGSIIITNIQDLPVYNNQKTDSVRIYNYWNRYNQVDECGGIISQDHSISNSSALAFVLAAGAGHCRINTKNELDVEVPDNVYQYLTFQITKAYCEIKCLASCFGGVSSSTATLDYKIKFNGEILNSSNKVDITCVAPIVWASAARYGVGRTYYTISIRNENGLPGGIYTLEENYSNTATAVLFSSSASSLNTFLNKVEAILTP